MIAVLCLSLSAVVASQATAPPTGGPTAAELAGAWSGTVEHAGEKTPFALELEPAADGKMLLKATVEDDGQGFDTALAAGGGDNLGLRGMRDRVQAVGGALTIDSRPGAGTRVALRVPLKVEASA